MPTCQSCGGHVTRDYARVFGNNNDRVDGCPECRTEREMYEGRGAKADSSFPERPTAGGVS